MVVFDPSAKRTNFRLQTECVRQLVNRSAEEVGMGLARNIGGRLRRGVEEPGSEAVCVETNARGPWLER